MSAFTSSSMNTGRLWSVRLSSLRNLMLCLIILYSVTSYKEMIIYRYEFGFPSYSACSFLPIASQPNAISETQLLCIVTVTRDIQK